MPKKYGQGFRIFDLKHFIIPDKIILSAIFISLVYRLFESYDFLLNFLFSAIGASGFFLIIYLISRGKWIGFGDVKFGFFMGIFLGFPNIIVGLYSAFMIGAIIGVCLIIFGRKKFSSEVPFGPFLIVGTFLALLFGEKLINWYINLINI